jgi:hypothetical protein
MNEKLVFFHIKNLGMTPDEAIEFCTAYPQRARFNFLKNANVEEEEEKRSKKNE